LLGADTFSGTIAAIQVQVFDMDAADASPLETVMLKNDKIDETIVLPNVDVNDPLTAVALIIKRDGTDETQNIVVPAGLNELLLRITNIS
ncbi:MAG: hypothetical protein WA749_14145, partial [Gelidibacter sp.]